METRKKTVVAALLLQQGRLLICQRPADGAFAGKWEFPGGKVEPGEDPKTSLRRELEEELGILAQVGEEVWRVQHQYAGHAPLLLLFFAVTAYQGTIENRVFQQICWATPPELTRYDFLEADLPLVQKLTAGELLISSREILPPAGSF